MSLEHPAWGCNRLSDWLKLDGVSVSAPTIQSDIPVATILTDNGREFCGREEHPFELYLALNDIEHRRTKVRHPFTNGFVERFHGTVLDEFFRTAFRTKFYATVDQLYRPTSTSGWLTTTPSGRIRAIVTRAAGRLTPSTTTWPGQWRRQPALS